MMKVFFRFLTPLFMLLLSGHTTVLANVHADDTAARLENCDTSTHLSDPGYLLSIDDSIIYPTPDVRRLYKVVLNDNEIEEDETISLKKSLEIAPNYFASHFYTQTPGYIATSQKNRLPLSKHFFYTSTCQKFIIFRVIRL